MGWAFPALALESGLEKPEICRDPQVVEAYINDPLVHTRVTAGWGLAMLKAIALAYENAPRFPLPLLLMHGTGDRIAYPAGSQAYAALVPQDRLTFKIWAGMKHELHTDPEREQVFQFMVEWLDNRK
jgi:alpha-beta hydrolase superfamily lysophospholipase